MHEEITVVGCTCPLCGMTLAFSGDRRSSRSPTAPHSHGPGDSIEWEDDMLAINRETDTTNMIWQLIDREPEPRTRHRLEVHGW